MSFVHKTLKSSYRDLRFTEGMSRSEPVLDRGIVNQENIFGISKLPNLTIYNALIIG